MPFYEREDKIMEILGKSENISLEELSKKLFINYLFEGTFVYDKKHDRFRTRKSHG